MSHDLITAGLRCVTNSFTSSRVIVGVVMVVILAFAKLKTAVLLSVRMGFLALITRARSIYIGSTSRFIGVSG